MLGEGLTKQLYPLIVHLPLVLILILALKKPVVLDVYMKNIPTPTAGHWNIMDIYSPGKKVHHVATSE